MTTIDSGMTTTDDRPAVSITHPLWCRNYPEDGLIRSECDYEHRGVDYRLDAGETASYQVSVTVVEGFEVVGDSVLNHGPQVQLTVYDRESLGAPASGYLNATEVERLQRLLALAAGELSLRGRA